VRIRCCWCYSVVFLKANCGDPNTPANYTDQSGTLQWGNITIPYYGGKKWINFVRCGGLRPGPITRADLLEGCSAAPKRSFPNLIPASADLSPIQQHQLIHSALSTKWLSPMTLSLGHTFFPGDGIVNNRLRFGKIVPTSASYERIKLNETKWHASFHNRNNNNKLNETKSPQNNFRHC